MVLLSQYYRPWAAYHLRRGRDVVRCGRVLYVLALAQIADMVEHDFQWTGSRHRRTHEDNVGHLLPALAAIVADLPLAGSPRDDPQGLAARAGNALHARGH